jgi:hypothetical protein
LPNLPFSDFCLETTDESDIAVMAAPFFLAALGFFFSRLLRCDRSAMRDFL